jgi:hypothetical protein
LGGIRAKTHETHHTIAAARQIEARKFLASRSVACGDATKIFEAAECVLDEISLFVGFLVEAERLLSV